MKHFLLMLIVPVVFSSMVLLVWRMNRPGGSQDIRSRAAVDEAPQPKPLSPPAGAAASAYREFRSRYAPSARTVAVDDPANGISGEILVAFDPAISRTFVVSRIEGLVPPDRTVAHLWFETNAGAFQQLGAFVIEEEDGRPVGYGAKSVDAGIDAFRSLLISFDPPVEASAPGQIVWERQV